MSATTTSVSLAIATISLVAGTMNAAVDIRIQCDKPTVPLSPHLYGLFFEDINFGADGGLYAELVQNRSFEYYPVAGADKRGKQYHPLTAWNKIERAGARCELAVETSSPLNKNNPHYLEVRIDGASGKAGVANSGYDGIRIDANARYDVSLHARTLGWSGDTFVTVTLELADGTVAGSTTLRDIGGDWKRHEGVITSARTADDARLVVTATGKGTLALDMVSLFPQDTFLGRKNGLRKDLVEALRDLNPKFLRFPGGCIAHGSGLANAYHWKNSVGDVAERVPNWNLWGYHQTHGLGYFEYFQLCEDLGMEALPVIPVGVCCGFRKPFEAVPLADLQPYLDSAVDLIEFANGPASGKWGGLRARMGHPEPFNLHFVSLGNEEHDTPEFRERFPLFVAAIRKAHSEIKIIGTSGLGPEIPLYDTAVKENIHSSDEHYYESPEWFIANQHRFDSFERGKPKVFVGEYASRGSTQFNAVAEAAYLTGVERNGDVVDMTCYAPLFASLTHNQWNPDLIYFDKRRVLRTTNYYVQQMFGRNKGDVYLANTVTATGSPVAKVTSEVGVGSWDTAIEVKDLRVNGRILDPASWKTSGGEFEVRNGSYIQTSTTAEPAMGLSAEAFTGETVTFTLRAMKTRGSEGFLVRFGSRDGKGGYWWNLGGWKNSRHAIESITPNGAKSTLVSAPGSIQNDVWYDLKVELGSERVRCYLDGRLIHDLRFAPPSVSVSPTFDKTAGEVIVKLVNPTGKPVDANIVLVGLKSGSAKGSLVTLAGEAGAVNTVENPDTVKPVTTEIPVGPKFRHVIPAMSVQCLRVKAR